MSLAEPMGSLRRMIAYQQANGHTRLTPRQRRRMRHKQNQAISPRRECRHEAVPINDADR